MDLVPFAGGFFGLAGIGMGLFFAQKNRRGDRSDAHLMADSAGRVADSKNALDAWISISAANTSQIASLTARLDAVQSRAEKCEDVIVPRLEATITKQEERIAKLEAALVKAKA